MPYSNPSSGSGGSGGNNVDPSVPKPVPVKLEKLTPKEIADQEVDKFKSEKANIFTELQEKINDVGLIRAEAVKDPMTSTIADACKKLATRFTKIQTAVKSMMDDEKALDDVSVRRLLAQKVKTDQSLVELETWSKRLGVKMQKKRRVK